MKKKFLTFILTICLMLPFAFILSACQNGDGGNPPSLLDHDVYINGQKTEEFSCVYGENAITPSNVTVKSVWTDTDNNANVSLSDFNITVKWLDAYGIEQTTMPSFWTNGTGSTVGDYATTYEFILTLKSDESCVESFKVIVSPEKITNVGVYIYNGEENVKSAEMLWSHNEREIDPEKKYRVEIGGLDAGYDQQEHMQWAFIEKGVYDALTTPEQKKEYIDTYQHFSAGFNEIGQDIDPGTYYVFAYVPSWNNRVFGLYGDGKIYDYATLTIKRISVVQEKEENRVLQHSDWGEYKSDFTYTSLSLAGEITTSVDYENSDYIEARPYIFENGQWKSQALSEAIDNDHIRYIPVQAHAVLTADGYRLVGLKDVANSTTEWVYINEDGTYGDAVTDNNSIVAVDYKELASYKNGISVTFPVYYMAVDPWHGDKYIESSPLYTTDVKIRKYIASPAPYVDIGRGDSNTNKYITGYNTFEFTYGEKCQANWAEVWTIEQIMTQALTNSGTFYHFENFDEIEYSTEPYTGLIVLDSPHYAWRPDGTNYTSAPIEITYYINKKAVVENPEYVNAVSGVDYFANPIEVAHDTTLASYVISDYITIGNYSSISVDPEWVNIYVYKLTEGDSVLSKEELITKIRTQGVESSYDGHLASAEDSANDTFVVMYDISDTSSVLWEDETLDPKLFTFKLIASN